MIGSPIIHKLLSTFDAINHFFLKIDRYITSIVIQYQKVSPENIPMKVTLYGLSRLCCGCVGMHVHAHVHAHRFFKIRGTEFKIEWGSIFGRLLREERVRRSNVIIL